MSTGAAAALPPRTRADGERLAVLQATLAVAQQRGYHGTTTARVAAASGVDEARVRELYPVRHDMLCAALELAFERWYDEVPTFKGQEPLPVLRDELDRRLTRGVSAGRRAADFWRLGLLLQLEPALATSDVCELYVEVRERTREALHHYWRSILPDTLADDGLVDLAVRGHMSLVDGAMLALNATPGWDLERMMSLVARGLAAAIEREAAQRGGAG